MIGFPSGIPAKVAQFPVTYISTDLWGFTPPAAAFGGNSGSAIYNARWEIVGVLVRGNTDYYVDHDEGCRRVMTMEDGEMAPASQEAATFAWHAIARYTTPSGAHTVPFCCRQHPSLP